MERFMEIRNCISIIFILTFLTKNCKCLENNFCSQGDIKCQHSNVVNSPGTLVMGKCHKGYVLIRKQRTSLLQCVTECFITSKCEAINYRKVWNLCELVSNATSGNLFDEKECAFSDIVSWPTSLAGYCVNHECTAGTKCQWTGSSKTCIPAYCKERPPTIKYASFSEKFGVSRDIGTGFRIKCNEGYYMTGKSLLICSNKGVWINRPPNCCIKKDPDLMNRNRPRDCNVLPKHCSHGVYKISPTPEFVFDAYCFISQRDDHPNWLLIQKRRNREVSFDRNWSDYENGFGNMYSSFWLGNKKIHILTSTRDYSVKFDLRAYSENIKHVRYSHFKVGNSESNYRLNISGYFTNSDADSDMSYHNGMPFSTFDSDHDMLGDHNCAQLYHGGWWYRRCHEVNLNGLYGDLKESVKAEYRAQGIQWWSVTHHRYSLKSSKVWIRPNI